MSSFTAITSRLFNIVFKRPSGISFAGELCELDAMTAAAIVESKYVGAAAFCGELPNISDGGNDRSSVDDEETLGELLASLHCPNPRSSFASAMGLSMTGHRATVFLTSDELISCQDLLLECTRQHIPIVIHVDATDSHNAYHLSSMSGCMQFFAANSQEAVDLTMIARQVSETSLIPAIVAIDGSNKTCPVILPTEEQSEQWLGHTDDEIKCPTQSQRLIFGEQRRQVPDRWNLERPLLLSPVHKESSPAFAATREPYYDNELLEILHSSQAEWKEQTGRVCSSILLNSQSDADVVYICQGSIFEVVSQIESVKVASIKCLRPFPAGELVKAAGTSKKVIVLNTSSAQLCGDSQLTTEVKAALSELSCEIYGVDCNGAALEDIKTLVSLASNDEKLPSYAGVSFITEETPYPKLTSAMDELERSYPEIKTLSLRKTTCDKTTPNLEQACTSPLLESNLWNDSIGSLPRFWNQIGSICQDSNEELLTASPLLSTNAIPPLTSSLRCLNTDSQVLPIFDANSCDGDPSLWMTCPDGSISALVLSPNALLDAGIMKAGGAAASLRSIAGGLCKQIIAIAKEDMQPTFGDILALAFDALNPPADRRESLQEGLDAVIEAIGIVPIAKTPMFFDKDGANEFLIISINPDACKSPELIISSCAGHGIEPTARNSESVTEAKKLRDLILQLPDTNGKTIYRISQIEGMKLPAIMLSRHCHHAMASGDNAEVASGAKLVLRQALGLAEYSLQPYLQSLLKEIEELKKQLHNEATTLLADAIPSRNLDVIARAIESSGQDEVNLATLLSSLNDTEDAPMVNGEAVRMMASLATNLDDITSRLTHSSGGLGRARSGLTISGIATGNWAATFPWNPFSTPVAVNTTHTGCSMSVGLFEGQLQRVLADLNIIRKAKLVLENPIQAAHPDEEVNALSLDDLTNDERALCPPLIVVADADSMHSNALSELAWILDSNLPIKVLILGNGSADVALFGLTSCSAYIAQCSPSNPDHFASSMIGALQYDGPALVSVYAPSPEQHGFATEDLLSQAKLAVDCRVCPLFTYDPNNDGIFGTCIDITANPNYTSLLVSEELTPTKWASTQHRFNDGFDGEATLLARWQMLQELSGVITPFDDVARTEQEEAALQHKLDLEALAKEYEAKVSSLQEEYHAQAVASVTSGLMQMASQARKPEDAT